MTLDALAENFDLLEDWEERYRYLIDLGRALPGLPEAERTEAHRVRGCVSQVWLVSRAEGAPPVMRFAADSDAMIVRGLIAVLLALHNGRPAAEVAGADSASLLGRLGLDRHLSPNRRSGLAAMVERMRADARAAMAA